MNYVIYLDNNSQVICWGDIISCNKYINQLYSKPIDSLHYEDYNISNKYSSFYEDYEVFNVRGTDVYLTLGEIKLIKEGCQDEASSIRFIESELEKLIELTDVFDREIINELSYMRDFMDRLMKIHAKYSAENLFVNMDMDALHFAYQSERENKGLPIVYIR